MIEQETQELERVAKEAEKEEYQDYLIYKHLAVAHHLRAKRRGRRYHAVCCYFCLVVTRTSNISIDIVLHYPVVFKAPPERTVISKYTF